MYGYECYYDCMTIYVRHIDTGYSIKYHESMVKSESALEDALAMLDEADDYEDLKEAFEEWVYDFTKRKRRTVKQEMIKKQMNITSHTHTISLGNQSMTTTTQEESINGWVVTPFSTNQEKGNNPMCYVNTTADNENLQRKYLLSQLSNAYTTKHDAMHTAFHMDPQGPKNIGEMIQWIKDGKYADLKDNEKENIWLNEIGYLIKWEDKANPPQTEKYNEARKVLNKAHTDAERVIKIKSPEAGLDALTAFESATFH